MNEKDQYGGCLACGIPLLESGGFYSTHLCGPCCTGESATIGMLTAEDKQERELNMRNNPILGE